MRTFRWFQIGVVVFLSFLLYLDWTRTLPYGKILEKVMLLVVFMWISVTWFLLLFFFFLQKQSEQLSSAAKDKVEAANPGTNVSVSKDHFDRTVTTLNIVCSDVFPWFFESQLCHSHFSRLSIDVHWSPCRRLPGFICITIQNPFPF